MDLFASQTAHAFGERHKDPKAGGRAVKDDRRGGHPSAQASFERGRRGGSRRGRAARSLTHRGARRSEEPTAPQASASGRRPQRQRAARGTSLFLVREPQRSGAWSHATSKPCARITHIDESESPSFQTKTHDTNPFTAPFAFFTLLQLPRWKITIDSTKPPRFAAVADKPS